MLISPPGLVLSCAFCNVRHGAVRVQALVSRPFAEMNERVLSACAGAAPSPTANTDTVNSDALILIMESPPVCPIAAVRRWQHRRKSGDGGGNQNSEGPGGVDGA